MNRKKLKEVTSSHLNKAGENKANNRQEYSSLYYKQNKEEINRQRRARRKLKKVEPKITSTNANDNETKTNVEVKNGSTNERWNPEKKKEFQRKWIIEKRSQNEGLNSGSPLLERNDKDFLDAKSLITWLEETKNKAEKFPRQWLKERLAKESKEFWTTFGELLKNNRSQYRNIPKLRLPLTLKTLQQWQSEKVAEQPKLTEKPTAKQSTAPNNFSSYPLYQFHYELTNNRLWFKGWRLGQKGFTKQGSFSFHWTSKYPQPAQLYLELTPEKNYQLKASCQVTSEQTIRQFQAYFSTRQKEVISLVFYAWNEITVRARKKKNVLPLLSKGERKMLLS